MNGNARKIQEAHYNVLVYMFKFLMAVHKCPSNHIRDLLSIYNTHFVVLNKNKNRIKGWWITYIKCKVCTDKVKKGT